MSGGVASLPGVRTHSSDSTVAKSGRTISPILVSPRFSLAYDLFGNGKTALRGGIGAYYYQDQYNLYAPPLALGNGANTWTAHGPTPTPCRSLGIGLAGHSAMG